MIIPPPIPPNPFARPTLERSASVIGAVRLQNVAHRGVDWLWPRRVPIGKVTLLVGEPGLGKSLIALDIAARVSTGKPWPDEEQGSRREDQDRPTSSEAPLAPSSSLLVPKSVLLMSAEDDLADTIRHRLEAAGADCSRILAIPSFLGSSCEGGVPREHELQRNLLRLRRLVESLPDCRLLIIDPISAYLSGCSNTSVEVRRLLVPLAMLAQERQFAIIATSHPRKQTGSVLNRTVGSFAFVAAARAAWILCQDPADTDRRLMLPMKCNLAARTPGLAYTVESKPVRSSCPNPQPESYASPEFLPAQANERSTAVASDSQPIIRWFPDPIQLAADDALRRPSNIGGRPADDRQHAMRWLEQVLAAGFRGTNEVEQEAVAHGIRLITLRRAFRDLDGKAFRLGFSPGSHWFWQLPASPDTPVATPEIDDQSRSAGLDHLRANPEDFARIDTH